MKKKFISKVLVVIFVLTSLFGTFAPASVSADIPKTGQNLFNNGDNTFRQQGNWQFVENVSILENGGLNGNDQDNDGGFLSLQARDAWNPGQASYQLSNTGANKDVGTYVVSFWYKGDATDLRVEMTAWPSTGKTTYYVKDRVSGNGCNPAETTIWTYTEFEFTSTDGAPTMYFYNGYSGNANGTNPNRVVYIDNIQIHERGIGEATSDTPAPTAEPTVPPIVPFAVSTAFRDKMVLQRNQKVNVYGVADAGTKIKVAIGDQLKETTATSDNTWCVQLDPMAAGGPYTLRATDGYTTYSFSDVLVGEVWLITGQSNAANTLGTVETWKDRQNIRFVMGDGRWEPCSSFSTQFCSELGYKFTEEIYEALGENIPMGIITVAESATPIEYWLDPDSLTACEAIMSDYELKGQGFKKEIEPFVGYTMRGIVWSQGENNTTPGIGNKYSTMLRTMITNWRKLWGYNFPFIIMQLPYIADQWHPAQDEIVESTAGYAEARHAQFEALSLPYVYMVTTYDCADGDIHPKNKDIITERASLIHMKLYEGQDIEYSSPICTGYEVEGNQLILTFAHADGLRFANGATTLEGMGIAGSDNVWYKANGTISGNKLILTNPNVPNPTQARYTWADNITMFGNVENGAGLPLGTFRADSTTIWPTTNSDTPPVPDIKPTLGPTPDPTATPEPTPTPLPAVTAAPIGTHIPTSGDNLFIYGRTEYNGNAVGSFAVAGDPNVPEANRNGNWTLQSGKATIITDSETDGSSQDGDGYFLKLTGNAGNGARITVWNISNTTTPLKDKNATFVVTFWARGLVNRLMAYTNNSASVLENRPGAWVTDNEDEWRCYQYEYSTDNSTNTNNVDYRFYSQLSSSEMNSGKAIYIDNIQVHKKGEAPIVPTEAPVVPTEAPVEPTEAPVVPTDAPAEPTEAPVVPTEAPVVPTEAPAEPTEAPTLAPSAPTTAPTVVPAGPTAAPTDEPAVKPAKKKVTLKSVKPGKLTTKVKKITGKTTAKATVKLQFRVKKKGKVTYKTIKSVKANKKGVFKFKKLNLKKYKKKALRLYATKSGYTYKAKTFKAIKK